MFTCVTCKTGALLRRRTQRGGLPRDGVGEAAWLRRLPADDGAAMEAEVAAYGINTQE